MDCLLLFNKIKKIENAVFGGDSGLDSSIYVINIPDHGFMFFDAVMSGEDILFPDSFVSALGEVAEKQNILLLHDVSEMLGNSEINLLFLPNISNNGQATFNATFCETFSNGAGFISLRYEDGKVTYGMATFDLTVIKEA